VEESKFQSIIKKAYITLLLVIFGGILLHTPISVGFGVLFPDFGLFIKSWKEILMALAGLMAIYLLIKDKQLKLLKEPIILLIGIYAILHLVLSMFFNDSLTSKSAGLLIDLRYVLFFGLVYIAIKMWPNYRNMFLKVGLAGVIVVVTFALLQIFILPKDILKYIGYGANSISPYMTVDQNPDFIRINSTLRGPNPLGAYMVIILSMLLAFFCKFKSKMDKQKNVIILALIFGGIITLWFSYSRSAIVAAALAVFIIIIISFLKKVALKRIVFGAVGALLISLIGVFVLFGSNYFVSNVLLHQNPSEDKSINSNEGHINSLQTGFNLLIIQPFGGGIGSTGSASLYGTQPIIIENQYLFIAHEAGWLGLGLFISIFGLIIFKLWKKRKDWLALGVLASGIGLAVIGLLLPVWVDDTVSIVWWGLAAIALANKE